MSPDNLWFQAYSVENRAAQRVSNKFFPSELTASLLTILEIVEVFQREGLFLESSKRVRQQTCHSLSEFAERTKLRADSAFVQLSDWEFKACQRTLEEAAQDERDNRVCDPAAILSQLSIGGRQALWDSASLPFGR